MKNNTYIVLLPIQNGNCRTQLEGFENENFENKNYAIELINDYGCKDFEIYNLSDFMDLCNDELFEPNKFWLGYINILE